MIVAGLVSRPQGVPQGQLFYGGIVFVLDDNNIMGHTLCLNIVK